jgi:hypothetical protein
MAHGPYKTPKNLGRDVKADARVTRRALERQAIGRVLRDSELDEDAVFPTQNRHVADRWSWD